MSMISERVRKLRCEGNMQRLSDKARIMDFS